MNSPYFLLSLYILISFLKKCCYETDQNQCYGPNNTGFRHRIAVRIQWDYSRCPKTPKNQTNQKQIKQIQQIIYFPIYPIYPIYIPIYPLTKDYLLNQSGDYEKTPIDPEP